MVEEFSFCRVCTLFSRELTKNFFRYTPGKLKQTIAEQFTKLGEQTRTIKFVNDVMALPLSKVEDV